MVGDDRGYGPAFAAAPDATGGALTLDVRDPRAVHAPVVDLVETPDVLADALDIPWRGSFRHGFCWGLLVPDGEGASVVVMGHSAADLDGPGVLVGRIAEVDARRFRELWAGRTARVSVLVEATPGMLGLEVRYRSVPADPPAAPEPRPTEITETTEPAAPAEAPAPVTPPTEPDVPMWAAATAAVAAADVPDAEPAPLPEPESLVEHPVVAEPEALAEHVPPAEHEAVAEPALVAMAEATTVFEPEPEPTPTPVAIDPSTLMPPGVPAGWYVDPFDTDELRWWDGTAWSVDAAPRPAVSHGEA